MGSKSEEFNAVKVNGTSSRRAPSRISHSAFSLASQLNLPPGCKLALNSVLATRVTTQGPPLVVEDGDTELKMEPGFMRQSVTDTTITEFVGMGAANPMDHYEGLLQCLIHDTAPLREQLEILRRPRSERLARPVHIESVNDTWVIVGNGNYARKHRNQEVILGVMGQGRHGEPDKQIRTWFIIFGGAPVVVDTYTKTIRGRVTGKKIVLRCGPGAQIVHNAGVSCRVKDSTITIKLKDGDVVW